MRQNISQLEYALISEHPPLDPLRVLERKSIHWRGWIVTFCILGASHAALFERDGVRFMEILACLPKGDAFWKSASSLEFTSRGDVFTEASCIIDSLSVQIQILPTSIEQAAMLNASDSEGFMQFPFELDEPALGSAVTQISWFANQQRLTLQTLHSYPEESKAVRTMTIFEEQKT
jgi:hypothetical protein